MRYLMIWKCVGCVSAISGLVCFGLTSTFKKSFGKLASLGLLAYLCLGLIMSCLILRGKRIRVPEKFQGLVAALISVVICCVSVLLDKLVTGQSDALSIISYASFALMSLSVSRKSELGFETGVSAFFLSLFVQQLCKINLKLLPIAVIFLSVVIILRQYSESTGEQFGSSTPNGYQRPIEDGPPYETRIVINDKGQYSAGELSQSTHHSPSMREVSEESILDRDREQNMEQDEDPSSLPAESWEQDYVSSGNNALTTSNCWMPSYGEPESSSRAPAQGLLRRRRRWMTPGIPNISSSVRHTIGWWLICIDVAFHIKETHHSQSIGQVSEGSIFGWDIEQINKLEEDPSFFSVNPASKIMFYRESQSKTARCTVLRSLK